MQAEYERQKHSGPRTLTSEISFCLMLYGSNIKRQHAVMHTCVLQWPLTIKINAPFISYDAKCNLERLGPVTSSIIGVIVMSQFELKRKIKLNVKAGKTRSRIAVFSCTKPTTQFVTCNRDRLIGQLLIHQKQVYFQEITEWKVINNRAKKCNTPWDKTLLFLLLCAASTQNLKAGST